MRENIFKKNSGIFIAAAVFFILASLDMFTKAKVAKVFLNYNFAFSLPLPSWLMYLLYALIFFSGFGYVWVHWAKQKYTEKIGWFMVFCGASLNIGERLVLGYVRDWIYIWQGVFNLADVYIIIGLAILLFIRMPEEKIKS